MAAQFAARAPVTPAPARTASAEPVLSTAPSAKGSRVLLFQGISSEVTFVFVRREPAVGHAGGSADAHARNVHARAQKEGANESDQEARQEGSAKPAAKACRDIDFESA